MNGFDPKLRVAMEEIQKVLDKHDVGAFVGLFSKTHAEFKMHIEPSWSQAAWKRDPKTGDVTGFRLKVRQNMQKELDATAALFCNMRDLAALFFQYSDKAIDLLKSELKIDHTVFGQGINAEGLVPPNAVVKSFPGGKADKDEK